MTDQIEYQQELRKSIERYEIVSKATRDTIWDWNLETDTIEYSQNFYNMFGYEQQQVNEIEGWWRDKIHPDDRAEVLDTIGKAQRASSERFQIEYRFQAADGTYKYIYDRAFMVEDQEGKPTRVIGAMRDVTDQKEAQHKMKEAFQERERILDRINEAFFAIDQNWNVTYWNKHAEEVMGVTRDDILGKNLWEKFPVAKKGKFFKEYKRALKEQVPVQFEEYYSPIEEWFEVNAYPSEEGLSVFFRGITERKEAEQELRELYQKNRLVLESTDEGLYGIDTEGRCTFINRAAANML
ncbi:PAS domain-containing protein, partial [Gracilimonas sp.]|uniref:PAS domain-containing protein n=1 Tax=Gracilimonas sp. TaxID=1974203 RepID=UPI003750EC64